MPVSFRIVSKYYSVKQNKANEILIPLLTRLSLAWRCIYYKVVLHTEKPHYKI